MSVFHFKHFDVVQKIAPQKVGTDAMLLGALTTSLSAKKNCQTILDIGTGNGVLALMMAQKFLNATVVGIDKDAAAVKEAQFNFSSSPFSERLSVIHQSFLKVSFPNKFDLIITNPPYYSDTFLPKNERRLTAKHETQALLSKWMEKSAKILHKEGELWIILPLNRTIELVKKTLPLKVVRHIQLFGKPGNPVRDVLCLKHNNAFVEKKYSTFLIRDVSGNYTDEYKRLTKDFHGKKVER